MAGTDQAVRKPAVAGTFYPSDRERLEAEIEAYLRQVNIDLTARDIVALVAPHAGYVYSGWVAACAYNQVRGRQYDTVVVVSPSHREYFEFSSVFQGPAYETPLGKVEIDTGLSREIAESGEGDNIRLSTSGHLHSSEHSLEVHLPFLQLVLDKFSLVAIVMGRQDEDACRELGGVLGRTLAGRNALMVASSDLSHFHDQKTAEGLDRRVVERIGKFDPEGLLADVAAHNCEACGAGPVAAVMMAAKELGAAKAENLCYSTSGEISGDMSQVVGYASAAIYR